MSLRRNSLLLVSVVDVVELVVVVVVLDMDSLSVLDWVGIVEDSVLEEVVITSGEPVVDTSDELEVVVVVDVLSGLSEVLVELGTGAGFFLYRISLEPAPQYS